MPNLLRTTEAYAEDLVMATEEILEPDDDEVVVNKGFRKSHLQILAVSEMILRLKELK